MNLHIYIYAYNYHHFKTASWVVILLVLLLQSSFWGLTPCVHSPCAIPWHILKSQPCSSLTAPSALPANGRRCCTWVMYVTFPTFRVAALHEAWDCWRWRVLSCAVSYYWTLAFVSRPRLKVSFWLSHVSVSDWGKFSQQRNDEH